MKLPDCGIYLTTKQIAQVPAGRLVYFHNHGDPGPGIYLPESWYMNRAKFATRGTPIVDHSLIKTLKPLPKEGLYQVKKVFTCCDKKCRSFAKSLLVQLGYNGKGEPILFVPKWTASGLAFPERGQMIDLDRIEYLTPLMVEQEVEKSQVPHPSSTTTLH